MKIIQFNIVNGKDGTPETVDVIANYIVSIVSHANGKSTLYWAACNHQWTVQCEDSGADAIAKWKRAIGEEPEITTPVKRAKKLPAPAKRTTKTRK